MVCTWAEHKRLSHTHQEALTMVMIAPPIHNFGPIDSEKYFNLDNQTEDVVLGHLRTALSTFVDQNWLNGGLSRREAWDHFENWWGKSALANLGYNWESPSDPDLAILKVPQRINGKYSDGFLIADKNNTTVYFLSRPDTPMRTALEHLDRREDMNVDLDFEKDGYKYRPTAVDGLTDRGRDYLISSTTDHKTELADAATAITLTRWGGWDSRLLLFNRQGQELLADVSNWNITPEMLKYATNKGESISTQDMELVEDNGNIHVYKDENGSLWGLDVDNPDLKPITINMAGKANKAAALAEQMSLDKNLRDIHFQTMDRIPWGGGKESVAAIYTFGHGAKGMYLRQFDDNLFHSEKHYDHSTGTVSHGVSSNWGVKIDRNGPSFSLGGGTSTTVQEAKFGDFDLTQMSDQSLNNLAHGKEIDFGSDDHYKYENVFQRDFDDDGIIGTPNSEAPVDTLINTNPLHETGNAAIDAIDLLKAGFTHNQVVDLLVLRNSNASLGSAVTPEPMIQSDPLVAAGPLDAVKLDEPRNNDF